LATTGGGVRLWRVGTWEEGPVVNGSFFCAFSPDSRTIAVNTGYGSIRLADATSGREYAELETPKAFEPVSPIFTPDATSLLGVAGNILGYAWDLRRIRQELAARGLDWDSPPYPPADESSAHPFADVELVLAEPDLQSHEDIVRAEIARLRQAHDKNPTDAVTCNALAWALVTAPNPLRRPDEAMELAIQAVRLNPEYRQLKNTLGVAYYRAGRFREAADCLAANLGTQVDSALPFDLYFLAMSYHQLGEASRARDCLVLANRWTDSHASQDDRSPTQRADLETIRAEAEALIRARHDGA
jgi:tetratricopeptide (TPR) repeat protein